ncbi:hypothetical protein BDZ85DRAFT_27910 [Elsinoe ampelina]|uniref:BTB domain-containing protein n=1 Tax=Elsinoe ampelina TaxID=302913 RepID=A0A6A6G4H7_9PEZI|nr:hypothetical protein BDZ85DRAFT_27910 [Elsinoe ampelina]
MADQAESRSTSGSSVTVGTSPRDSCSDSPCNHTVTIRFGDNTFIGNRDRLIKLSDYFKAMLGGNFAEAQTKEIQLHDDDPKYLRRMLQSSERDVTFWIKMDDAKQMTRTHELYKVADKYQFTDLQQQLIRTTISRFGHGEEWNHDQIKDAVMFLRKLPIRVLEPHYHRFITTLEAGRFLLSVVYTDFFERFLEDHPKITVHLLRNMLWRESLDSEHLICNNCGFGFTSEELDDAWERCPQCGESDDINSPSTGDFGLEIFF